MAKMIHCKSCGKEIASSAKACPSCGAKNKKPFYKTVWFWIIVAIVIIGVASAGGSEENISNYNGTSNNGQGANVIEYQTVLIDDLEDALDVNAAAAKDTYNGKYLEITGRLGTIDSDLKYISLLSLTNEWDFVGIHCSIKNTDTKEIVKSLKKNQTIVVRGKITDVGEVLGYYLDIYEIIPQ